MREQPAKVTAPSRKRRRRRKPFRFNTPRNVEAARALLLEIAGVLDAAGVDYMLDAGTLLGIVRDGDLIPWDGDLDISIPARGLPKLLELLRRGRLRHRWISRRFYSTSYTCWKPGDYRVIKVRNRRWMLFKGPLVADLYIKYPAEGYYYWTSMRMISRAEARYFERYEEIEWRGHKLKVPAHYQEYLAKIYGDWRTPRPEYKPQTEDGTVIGALADLASASEAAPGGGPR